MFQLNSPSLQPTKTSIHIEIKITSILDAFENFEDMNISVKREDLATYHNSFIFASYLPTTYKIHNTAKKYHYF